jgi:ABC-2 type transport system ATP-binding protein
MNMELTSQTILFENVSKFYGDVLGISKVQLSIPKGITGLVGPNGSGKTTFMNLLCGLLRPTQGSIRVLGISPYQPEQLFSLVGYCTQFDSFPRNLTGRQFLARFLEIQGTSRRRAAELAHQALVQVNMLEAADRKVASYSKGMRQRIKLAQAIAHEPQVLILDEPLNGLDPLARMEMLALFRAQAQAGRHVLISSHILHELDKISDQVILLSNGRVMAEGNIHEVRREMPEYPLQILIRCDRPALLAARVLEQDHVVEIRMHDDRQGLLVKTRDADKFYLMLNEVIVETGMKIDTIFPADDDVHSVYEYLLGPDGQGI